MDFLKKLFGGGSRGASGSDRGKYFYVQPQGCDEVVRIRVDMNNEPSLDDDNSTYFVRKFVQGTTYKCNKRAELYMTFDASRRVQKTEVTDGKLVTEADYDAWMTSQDAASS